MNEKHINILSLILAFAALVLSTLDYSMWLMAKLDIIDGNLLDKIRLDTIYLFFWGWIPGLLLTIITFLVSRRLKSKPLKSFIWLILFLSFISALSWATFAIGILIYGPHK